MGILTENMKKWYLNSDWSWGCRLSPAIRLGQYAD